MSLTETAICNMALARIGASRITDIDSDTSPAGVNCEIHFDQTRDALLRSCWWRFASGRLALVGDWVTGTAYTTDQYVWSSSTLYKCIVAHTSTTGGAHDEENVTDWLEVTTRPSFGWDYIYAMPADFIRMKAISLSLDTYALEGKNLLTDDTEVNILYVKQITDVTEFDPMFTEAFVLSMALKLVMPLSQDKVLRRELQDELQGVMSRARLVNMQETETTGRNDMATWIDSRYADSGLSG